MSAPSSASATAPRFAAFRHPNFRLFWGGNLVSLIGTLAERTAMGWLTRYLTADPRFITFVAACATLPILFFSLHAGAIADRVDKRRALLFINAVAALAAAALGVLVLLHLVQLWHVILFALASGVLTAFDIPIRQSFNIEMVGREDLPSAIALNSTAFNAARVLGPAVGGFLIQAVSIAGCFLINALSFGGIIAALFAMHLEAAPSSGSRIPFKGAALWRGVLYVRRHQTLRLIILLVGVVSFFAMSSSTLLPTFAKDVFASDARGYSILLTCNGVGALVAASSLAMARTMRHKGKRLLLGAFVYCVSTLAFAVAPTLPLAGFCLVISGFFLLTFLMAANTLVQTLSPDTLRGRVFALYSMSLVGATPVGAITLGFLAKAMGARQATELGSFLAAIFIIWVYFQFRALWKEK